MAEPYEQFMRMNGLTEVTRVNLHELLNIKTKEEIMYNKFAKIGHNFGYAVNRLTEGIGPAVYFGYVKIHGTNSAVGKVGGKIFYQSRNRILTPEKDNFGFARAMSKIDWESKIPEGYIVYGEWAGKGIQKKVGISKLPKTFYPFMTYRVETETWEQLAPCSGYSCEGVDAEALTIPYMTVTIDAANRNAVGQQIQEATLEVEQRCPVAFAQGVDGVGEGLVFRPCVDTHGNIAYESETWFKSKGGEHSDQDPKMPNQKTSCPVSEAFLIPLIEARGVQGLQYLQEMNHRVDMSSTGEFIKWMMGDINDEVEIPEEVNTKYIGTLAANWYKANHQSL
jgi:hypothetical protein